MSKGKVIFLSFIMLLGIYVCLMLITINGFNVNKIWFSLSLIFIGIYALIYSFLYKLDSCLYYAMLNINFGITSLIKFLNSFKFSNFYPVYFLCILMAHLTVYLCYRQKIHFKLFALFLIEFIILLSYKMNFLNLWLMLAINIILIIFILFSIMFRLRKNLRSE